MTNDSFDELVRQRQVSDLVVKRLVEHVYDRPLINNVERGAFVECLVEIVMRSADPRWRLTETWDPWDIEHPVTGARLEIKQSSVLQSWPSPPSGGRNATPSFGIPLRDNYWWTCPEDEYHTIPTKVQRYADVYVFAWHCETDNAFADHREARQWKFFVVREHELPPGQKSIGLNPLRGLAQPCSYRALAETVTNAIPDSSLLKATLDPPPQQCPTRSGRSPNPLVG